MHVSGSFKILFVINCQGLIRPRVMQCADLLRYCLMTSCCIIKWMYFISLYSQMSSQACVPKSTLENFKKIIIWENFSHLNEINLNSKRAQLLLFIIFFYKSPQRLKGKCQSVFHSFTRKSDISSELHQLSSQALNAWELNTREAYSQL